MSPCRAAQLAEQNRPPDGIPIPEGMEDVDAFTVMRQHEIEAECDEVVARGGLGAPRSSMSSMLGWP